MVWSDQAVGYVIVTAGVTTFVYYTCWLFLLPFVEDLSHPIHSLFPSTELAIAIPTTLFVVALCIAFLFIGLVLTKESPAKKKR